MRGLVLPRTISRDRRSGIPISRAVAQAGPAAPEAGRGPSGAHAFLPGSISLRCVAAPGLPREFRGPSATKLILRESVPDGHNGIRRGIPAFERPVRPYARHSAAIIMAWEMSDMHS